MMASCMVQNPVHDNLSRKKRLPILRSNQGNHVDAASTGWMHSVTTETSKDEIRARYERDGYVWVKNLIPREDVLDMREQ